MNNNDIIEKIYFLANEYNLEDFKKAIDYENYIISILSEKPLIVNNMVFDKDIK